jgi:hypothetical protein
MHVCIYTCIYALKNNSTTYMCHAIDVCSSIKQQLHSRRTIALCSHVKWSAASLFNFVFCIFCNICV